jgi:hypothetical protein
MTTERTMKKVIVALVALACVGCLPALPTSPGDPVAYCGQVGMFYCNTTIVVANMPALPNGWAGFCSAGNFDGVAGWTVIYTYYGDPRATGAVFQNSQDWDDFCNHPNSAVDPGCIAKVRCTK